MTHIGRSGRARVRAGSSLLFPDISAFEIVAELPEEDFKLFACTLAERAFGDVLSKILLFFLRQRAIARFAHKPGRVFAGDALRHVSGALPMDIETETELHSGSIKKYPQVAG